MKRKNKVISFILVLSLLFSSLIFTAGAETVESLDDINKTEFYEPTANFTQATASTKNNILKTSFANFSYLSSGDITGDGCLETYLVEGAEDDNTNTYVMVVPSPEAVANGAIPENRHSQINAGSNTTVARNGQSNYYIFEVDIATDAILLPMKFEMIVRNDTGSGSSGWGSQYAPSANFKSLITPGVFHHVTLVGDLDSNSLYIFIDNALVDIHENKITSSAFHNEYMNGSQMRLEAMRIQWAPGDKIEKGSSICFDNAKERIFLGAGGNIANCLATGDLSSWTENVNYSDTPVYLPSIVEINGVKYKDTQSATAALQTYKLGTKVKALRACYGGVITVNCDAEITIPVGADIEFKAGEDVELIKGDGSIWHAVLKNFKHSAKVISKNDNDIAQYVRHPAKDNLINNIRQSNAVNERTFSEAEFENLATLIGLTEAEKALFEKNTSSGNTTYKISGNTLSAPANVALLNKFTSHSIDGSIVSTDNGNEYLIVQDNSGTAGDFPLNVHYQVNANTSIPVDSNDSYIDPSKYQIGNHKFVVFEQDIHSESEFINIYNAFNLRTPSNLPLSNIAIFAEKINITSEKWYHLTYIGEVASGDTYLFLDGKCIARIVQGLYDNAAIGKMAASLGMINGIDRNDKATIKQLSTEVCITYASQLTEAQRQECIDNMVLASFRTMQIAGENMSGKNLTPDMSAASDNYYLRWADDTSMTALIAEIDADYEHIPEGSDTPDATIDGDYYINSWGDNIYDANYIENILPEKALIATINGVEYYDTTSINAQLNNSDYKKTLQEVVLYREYIGTIVVNCRATVKLNGITSHVAYNEYDATTNPTGCIVDRTKDPIVVYMNTPADKPQGTMELENESAVDMYKEVNATASDILGQWKYTGNTKPNNLYTSHSISTSNTKKTQIFSSYNNSNKTANYTDDFSYPIYDKGAQTHTFSVGNASMAPTITASVSGTYNTTSTGNGNSKVYTTTVETDLKITKTQYYVVIEFDIASNGNNASNVTLKNTVNNSTHNIANLGEYLSNSNSGEYIHVTVIGCVDASYTGSVTTSISRLGYFTNSGNASYNDVGTPDTQYSISYNIYVDNSYKGSVNGLSAGSSNTWNNFIIENGGNNISVENVYAALESETTENVHTSTETGTSTGNNTGSTSRNNTISNYNNDTKKTGNNTLTVDEQKEPTSKTDGGDTTLNECFATTGTLSDSTYGKTNGYTMPETVTSAAPDFSTQTPETYPNGTFTTVPDPSNPKVNYPIASVDGVLYYANSATDENGQPYANNETALKELLEKPHNDQRNVIFLRETTQPITIVSNAQVDYNGLDLTGVTLGNSDCVVAEGSQISTVINLTGTTVVANMNGVDYFSHQIAELQAAVTAADEVTISFYSVPASPIKILSSANIDTNGIIKGGVTQDQLFITDDAEFIISKNDSASAEYDYTITEKIRTATVEVRVVENGTVVDVIKVNGEFHKDIAELLTEKGLMSGVFVVGDKQLSVTNWDVTPSGIINKENVGGESAYVYTANVNNEKSVTITEKYAYVTSTGIVQSNSENDVRAWLEEDTNGTIVFYDDLDITGSTAISLNGNGKSVYLNGHSLNFKVMEINSSGNVAGVHGFIPTSHASVSFYGDGAINYVTNAGTNALFFNNYNCEGTMSLNGLTINSTCSVAQIRGGHYEFNNCVINNYNYNASNAFALGEQYNGNYSKTPITLTFDGCDIDFRYYRTSNVYPFINSKIVTSADDPSKTVIIHGCNIKSQGAILRADDYESGKGDESSYLRSNTKLYISESSIMAQSIATGMMKANSIYFCDDVRTNVVKTSNIAFATDVVSAKVSDGLYNVLYTSHAYAAITWSSGVTEYWATGSTPNSFEHRFDGITAGGIGADQENSSYESTGTKFPFGLLANLTLSDRIGFNVYVPTTLKNGTAVNTGDVKVYLDGKEISPNYFPGTSTVRTSIVAAAVGYGDGYCYDYTLTLAPQEAAKSFTIVIVYGGQCVSRTVSVADYAASLIKNGTNEKNLALLSVTLAYIEKATEFAGYIVDMSKIQALRAELGTKTATIQAPTLPEVTHTETESDFAKYFAGVQMNIRESGAFRFRLQSGVNPDGFEFYIANDKNDGYEIREHKIVTVDGNVYLELSLRAFEMARSIKIVNGGEYDLYSLYQCYNATKTLANATIKVGDKSYVTGITYEYKASLTLIETVYHYASICDKYLDKNAAEYQPAN